MNRPGYLVVSCRLGHDGEELLAEALMDLAVLGSEIIPEAGSAVTARIYFDSGDRQALSVLLERLVSHGATAVAEGELEAEDWLRAFRARAVAFPVGAKWWIDPKPGGGEPPPGRTRLAVEPRMAFGSGSHETTQLVLMELERLPLSGRSLLDIGTGSGILALAASTFGATPVVGLDIDLLAVFEARRTAAEQDFDSGALFLAASLEALSPGKSFGLVLCNMIWEKMRPLLPRIFQLLAPGGVAVLSGMLAAQETPAVEELHAHGFAVTARRELGEWLALVVKRG